MRIWSDSDFELSRPRPRHFSIRAVWAISVSWCPDCDGGNRSTIPSVSMTMISPTRVVLTLALVVGACGSQGTQASSESTDVPAQTSTDFDTPLPQSESTDLDRAVEDLATRLDVDPTTIELVSDELVVWSDTSVGCPEPGNLYAQMLTDGRRVVLRHDDRSFVYHAAEGEDLFLCTSDAADGGYSTDDPNNIPGKSESFTVKDGTPNESRDDEVVPPLERTKSSDS